MTSRPETAATRSTSCIFCHRPADSDEDIFPKWLDKTWQLPHGATHNEIRLLINNRDRGKVQRLAAKKTRSKCVCESCNNNWMSQLEAEVRPALAPLINGYQRMITQGEQLAIARWAALKAACYDANPRFSDPVVSDKARQTIRGTRNYEVHTGSVPDRWAVWLACYPRPTFGWHMPYSTGLGADREYLATFNFTLTLGFVALMVQGRTGGVGDDTIRQHPMGCDFTERKNPDLPPMLTLHPPRAQSISWPPANALTAQDLCDVVTFELPQEVENVDQTATNCQDIMGHDDPVDCNTCGDVHALKPTFDLPISEPEGWYPEPFRKSK